jgi:hypothetical protein
MLIMQHYNQRPFTETVCDALVANGGVRKPSKMIQIVCDARDIKHDADYSCVCDMRHIVHSNELFAMSIITKIVRQMKVCAIYDIQFTQKKCLGLGNTTEMVGQIKGVCDIRHTVQSDELFAVSENNRNGQPDQGLCDRRHTLHRVELFVISHKK